MNQNPLNFVVEIRGDVIAKDYDFTNDRGEHVKGTKRSQDGWLKIKPTDPYPSRVEVKLRRDESPYPAGLYHLSPESFRVYQGRLELMRLVLLPVPTKASQAA